MDDVRNPLTPEETRRLLAWCWRQDNGLQGTPSPPSPTVVTLCLEIMAYLARPRLSTGPPTWGQIRPFGSPGAGSSPGAGGKPAPGSIWTNPFNRADPS